jgi:hypothetical protein
MAKTIFAVEDDEARLFHLRAALENAVKAGALEEDDTYRVVGAHKQAHLTHSTYTNVAGNSETYVECRKFEKLKTILAQPVNKLILLDVDLEGVHGRGGSRFRRPDVIAFYAQLTNTADCITALLIYSTSQGAKHKVELIQEANGREDRIDWIDLKPDSRDQADKILRDGLNLYFNRPLQHAAISMRLSELHNKELSRTGFERYFKRSNSANMYPPGAMEWLTSDWLREVCWK